MRVEAKIHRKQFGMNDSFAKNTASFAFSYPHGVV